MVAFIFLRILLARRVSELPPRIAATENGSAEVSITVVADGLATGDVILSEGKIPG